MTLLRSLVRMSVMVGALFVIPGLVDGQENCKLVCSGDRDCKVRSCGFPFGEPERDTWEVEGECCLIGCEIPWSGQRCWDHRYYDGCCDA